MKKSFNKKKHEYLIDGKPATGITTIISVLAKPALIQWAANEAVNYIKTFTGEISEHTAQISFTPSVWVEMLEAARTAHCRKKEAAGTHGTDAHALVEEYVKRCLVDSGVPYKSIDARYRTIQPFIDWALQSVDHFLFSERQMFNKDLFIAGTADFGCVMKDGKKLIGDFKTSSGVYGVDYFLQCAGYKLLAEAEGDEPYDGCVIVRLGKKGPEDFDVTYRYDTQSDETGFQACLTLYRLQATYVKPI